MDSLILCSYKMLKFPILLLLRKHSLTAVFFCIIGLFTSCSSDEPKPIIIRASHLVNENHTWFQAFEYFAQILEERSEGRLVLENYHSEQLAKEIEAIRLIQAGVIDMTTTGSMLNNWIDIAAFCELPFLLRDSVDMKHLIEGEVGQRIEKEMLEKTGLRALGVFPRGPRHLTSNRPIRHPDDLNGMIVRVPGVPSFVTAWEAIGAKPTPMAFSEVFTALQQGTIDGQENSFAIVNSAGFAEVQKYINLTAHVVSWTYPVIGEEKFQSLPDDLKDIFLTATDDMVKYEHELFINNEKSVQLKLQQKGMEIIEVDKDAFSEKCREAIFKSLSPEMQEVYFQVLEMKKQIDENH
ncbi:MAG: TRAP transporter substrate-binding protein [Reichenbachiella sp.]